MVISENNTAQQYKVLPSPGMVLGFQYIGQLMLLQDGKDNRLSSTGVTGVADIFKVFANTAGVGTILVYFTETGFTHFSSCPAHELFNQSVSVDNFFSKQKVADVQEMLANAATDAQRIKIVEGFLLSQLKDKARDQLIIQAVNLIYHSKGGIRMKELHQQLHISQSAFEKRFRKLVGASPKKFASIIRFNTVLQDLGKEKTLTEICYDNNFFDQAHFIKDFRQFTGESPESFKRLL